MPTPVSPRSLSCAVLQTRFPLRFGAGLIVAPMVSSTLVFRIERANADIDCSDAADIYDARWRCKGFKT
jgi:hypothetical protein